MSSTVITLSTTLRSSKKGIISRSSESFGSLNQDAIGMAFVGWNIYEAGELSIIMTSLRSRPNWDKS